MKFLFKKKISNQKDEQQDNFFALLAKKIKPIQTQWAVWMQVKSEKLSLKAKWLMLILFCVLSTTVCVYLVSGVFRENQQSGIRLSRIKSPVHLPPIKNSNPVISRQEYEKFRAFKIYMDSLARSPDTKKEYEQILSQHPGLMDSIETVEQLYHSQFNQ